MNGAARAFALGRALVLARALARALGLAGADSLGYLTVSVLAALFVALPLMPGASSSGGCGGCGGLAGIIASSGTSPVQGTRVIALTRGALRDLLALFFGGGEPMSKYAAAVGTVGTGIASGAGGGGGGCGGCGGLGGSPPVFSTIAREARGFVIFLIFTEPPAGGGGGGPEPPVYCTTSMGESAGGIM